MKKKIAILSFIIIGVLILAGCGCKQQNPHQYNISLEMWGPIDDSSTYTDIFATYHKVNPNFQAGTYKKYNYDTYEQELLNALAAGNGPDIFLIHNDWLPEFQDKIVPAPASILTEQKFRQDFVDIAANDFITSGQSGQGNQIWAAPIEMDSLALYYNKDLFNEAGIATPPTSWSEFAKDVQLLTKLDASRQIVQSGAAIGTAYNINRSTDILSLLMMQYGAQMYDDNGVVAMNNAINVNGTSFMPAQGALNFYTQFAQTGSPYYSWNPNMHYSIDAFSEGRLAMMISYSWNIPAIKEKAPKLNFAVAPVPQFPGNPPVDYADYWGLAVAKNKQPPAGITNDTRIAESWDLIKFLTTTPDVNYGSTGTGLGQGAVPNNYDPALEYIKVSNEPSARRDLIAEQKNDATLGVFAAGNLIAKSWHETDPQSIENILANMIDQVNKGQASIGDAVEAASQRIGQLGH